MTTAVVRPGTEPRLRRGPAGRRVLQVVLFVGGLLALGLLFGARAQAVDQPVPQLHDAVSGAAAAVREPASSVVRTSAPVAPKSASVIPESASAVPEQAPAPAAGKQAPVGHKSAPPAPATPSVPAPRAEEASARKDRSVPADAATGRSQRAPEPVPEKRHKQRLAPTTLPASGSVPTPTVLRQLAEPKSEPARPVAGKALGTAVTGALDATRTVTRTATRLLPSGPSLADLPLRLLPLPQLPLPGQSSPATPQAPGSGSHTVPGATAGGDGHPAAPRPAPVSMSPAGSAPDGFSVAREATGASHRAVAADHRPEHREPFGPHGDRSGSSSAEFHPPRGGDQPAVSFTDGISFGLVRGAGLPATAAPVRDRSGDILEFPG
ncbi:hypothetical protein ACFVW8_12545 [Streptomyces sp. NPDC058221]|uniref:hypothetical protein n=1 Tax=Streptomyces sp. NPDC058221 TaxID=3346388 RepID=UPI0036E8F494